MNVKTEKRRKESARNAGKVDALAAGGTGTGCRPPRCSGLHRASFHGFFEQRGDRCGGEDSAILGGIARFHGIPVTVLGHRKGKNLDENLTCRFGMPSPEGYRKAQRLMEQAERFHRPVITFVDTPGAYPGKKKPSSMVRARRLPAVLPA